MRPSLSPAEIATDDPKAPQRTAADPTASVWVAASAGTGKTKILTDRVLSLLLAGTPPHRILCLTFTKAAAAEMSSRLTRQLAAWSEASEDTLFNLLFDLLGRTPSGDEATLARRLFPMVLDTPGGMNIQTIHAFCQSMLGRFPLEASVAPHFSVIDERDNAELLRRARDRLFSDLASVISPLTDALATLTMHTGETGFAELIASLANNRRRLETLIEAHGSVDAVKDAIYDRLNLEPGNTPLSLATSACADKTTDEQGLMICSAALQRGSKTDAQRGQAIKAWLTADGTERLRLLPDYIRAFLTDGHPPAIRKKLATKAIDESDRRICLILNTEANRLLDITQRCRAATTAQATAALLTLSTALLNEYVTQKHARALLDYDDLIIKAAHLLEKQGGSSWALFKLDGGIDHVLIDEAQDTSPEQWRVIRALTSEFFSGKGARDTARTVFAVGDVKQSIFSFQGANPNAFIGNRDSFGTNVKAAGQNWRPVELNWSFRSTRAILTAVDAVFSSPEARDGVALDDLPILHQAFRKLDGGSVEIWPLLELRDDDSPQPWAPPTQQISSDSPPARLARIIARRIAAMVHGKERLPSRTAPIRAGDIMVLVRRRTSFIGELVRELKTLQVQVAGVDRMLLSEQIAVMDLLALAHFALLPSDDLTLATVLKSPLLGLNEDHLFSLAAQRKGSLWAALKQHRSVDRVFDEAHRRLAEILSFADAIPPFEFFSRILGQLGGRRKLIGRLGRDADDAIGEFLQLTLTYERSHPPSLQGFLHWFETGRVEIKRDLEQDAPDAVRIMTVHGAKGLQAPIVILPDTTQVPKPHSPSLLWPELPDGREILLWPPRRDTRESIADDASQTQRQKDMQEYRRLLYVAMTRARDRMIVCGWHTAKALPLDCWYNLIHSGVQHIDDPQRLGHVQDEFLARDPEFDGTASILQLTYPQETEPGGSPGPSIAPSVASPPWLYAMPPSEPAMSRPLTPSHVDDGRPLPFMPLGQEAAGYRRGRLIHRLLQHLPGLRVDEREYRARAWLGRAAPMLALEAREDIISSVLMLLDDSEFAAVFAPGGLSEAPFSGHLGDQLITGQIDRLLINEEQVLIVDYKTDQAPPAQASHIPAQYLKQMAVYRAVLGSIYPTRKVRCALLWTQQPAMMILEDVLLDQYAP